MTELQMGLIGVGIGAVIVVISYNKWQERRYQKLAEKVLNSSHADALLDEQAKLNGDESRGNFATEQAAMQRDKSVFHEEHALMQDQDNASETYLQDDAPRSLKSRSEPFQSGDRIEPILGEPAGDASKSRAQSGYLNIFEDSDASDVVTTATIAEDLSAPLPPLAASASESLTPSPAAPAPSIAPAKISQEMRERTENILEPVHLLWPVIDYMARFELVEPVSVSQIFEPSRALISRLRKPVRWVGYNESTLEWDILQENNPNLDFFTYRKIRAGLQLVDRQGVLPEDELMAFHLLMQELAATLLAVVHLPQPELARDAALKLDEFCASVDIQIGINVISQGQVFQGTKLRALMEAAGMNISPDGRFVRRDDDGNILYCLQNQEIAGFSAEAMKTLSTHGVTFLLDVPRVAQGERVFAQMLEQARKLAEVMRGVLVDDNKNLLSENALVPIRQQIVHYQTIMTERGLPPGNLMTQRLFS